MGLKQLAQKSRWAVVTTWTMLGRSQRVGRYDKGLRFKYKDQYYVDSKFWRLDVSVVTVDSMAYIKDMCRQYAEVCAFRFHPDCHDFSGRWLVAPRCSFSTRRIILWFLSSFLLLALVGFGLFLYKCVKIKALSTRVLSSFMVETSTMSLMPSSKLLMDRKTVVVLQSKLIF